MGTKSFAIITDIHSNVESLKKALSIIQEQESIDQIICLGDCFALGSDPEETLLTLKTLKDCIFIRGNHDRYLIERLWEQERPSLEGMDPDDPICQAIVANIGWTAEQVGKAGIDFISKMHIAHREIVDSTLVEFTHAWYQRDDQPPTMEEALLWRNHVSSAHPELSRYIFIHGHVHIPRHESRENLTILCQGATGLPFDEDPRGSVAFLTIGDSFEWNVVRYEYDIDKTIQRLEERNPPFKKNLQNTIRYAAIRNDL
ncbi:MAG: metallophosphoesterase family protein [Fidelibacterota bacterium]